MRTFWGSGIRACFRGECLSLALILIGVVLLPIRGFSEQLWCIEDPTHLPCDGAPGSCTINHDGSRGGFVAKTANVEKKWFGWGRNQPYLARYSQVCDSAHVSNHAQVLDHSQVLGHARVSDKATLAGSVRVFDHAWIRDEAKILDHAQVYGHAEIFGSASIFDFAQVFGKVKVGDQAQIGKNSKISGERILAKDTQIFEK